MSNFATLVVNLSQVAFLSSAVPARGDGGVGPASAFPAAADDLAVEEDSALEGADPNANCGAFLRCAARLVMSAEWRWCWFRSSVRSITIV